MWSRLNALGEPWKNGVKELVNDAHSFKPVVCEHEKGIWMSRRL